MSDDVYLLCENYLEGRLADAEFQMLQDRIGTDPAFARAFARAISIESALAARLTSAVAVATPRVVEPVEPRPVAGRVTPVARNRWSLAVAAAVFLAAAAVTVYLALTPSRTEPGDQGSPPDSPVATMLEATGGGTLTAGDAIVTPGSEIRAGDLRLDTGSADFQLTNGVTVRLRGRTLLRIDEDATAMLAAGSATFDCPPGVIGYTVRLPDGARVVDLGTRFTVTLAPDASYTVGVSSGRVELRRDGARPFPIAAGQVVEGGDGSAWRLADAATALPVRDGLAVWLSADSGVDVDDHGRVERWANRMTPITGSGSDAEQPDAALRPRYIRDALHGRPVIRFDQHALAIPLADAPAGRTILAVARAADAPVEFNAQLAHISGTPVLSLEYPGRWTARRFIGPADQLRAHAVPDTRAAVVGFAFDAESERLTVVHNHRRETATSPSPTPEPADPPAVVATIGAHDTYKSAFRGDLAQLLVFDRVLTPDEIDRLVDHLADAYAIDLSPRVTSPESQE